MPISATAGKIELAGSLEDRLDQLDKRETELLGELEKSKKQVKRLKDEKTENRQRMEEYEWVTSFSDDITGTGIRPDIKSQPTYNVPGVNTCTCGFIFIC